MARSLIVSVAVLALSAATVAAVFLYLKDRPGPDPAGLDETAGEICPDQIVFPLPVDLGLATSILYPGQERGMNFKPHGGFRFDNSDPGEIEVRAPFDAAATSGARYLEDGEVQYMFEFETACEVRYRFDHLNTLTPEFQAAAERLPAPKEGDSRTSGIVPPIEVSQGDLIASAVGFFSYQGNVNTFVDWGVYDYRRKNESSQDPDWLAEHPNEIEHYGVCWFDWLSAEDEARVRALPSSDSNSGTASDYCR